MKFNYRPDTAQNYDQPFLAHIVDSQMALTGPFTGRYLYSWVEQVYDATSGIDVDAPSARTGFFDQDSPELTAQPAFEPNNRYVEPGAMVKMQVKGFVGELLTYQIVDAAPPCFVQVTDSTPVDGWFPGLLQAWDSELQDWYAPERWDVDAKVYVGGTVWVRDAGDQPLALDARYVGLYSGLYERVQSFITGTPAAASAVFKITGAYSSGYPWTRQAWTGSAFADASPTETGTNLYEVNGNTTIPVNKYVIAFPTPGDSSDWMCQYTNVTKDVEVGCGLEKTTSPDTIKVNLTEQVFDGLTWDNEGCVLSWTPGCGMTVGSDPDNPGLDAFAVDLDVLAGDAADTALVTHDAVYPSTCKSLAVDLDVATTSSSNFDKITGFSITAGKLRLSWDRKTVTVSKNAAGLPVNVEFGSAASMYQEVDICLAGECCDAEELVITECTRDPSSGDTSTVFSFDSTVAGGVPPYSYLWDFGDDETDTTNPTSHIYVEPGDYSPHLTVTDACGTVAECSPGTITVTGGIETDCCPDDPIPQNLNLNWKCNGGTTTLGDTTLTWNGTCWFGSGDCPTLNFPYEISLACLDDVWKVGIVIRDCEDAPFGFSKDFDGLCAALPGEITLVSCCPFEATFGVSPLRSCDPCNQGFPTEDYEWRFTITASGQTCPPSTDPGTSCSDTEGAVPVYSFDTGYPVSIDYATYGADAGWVKYPITSGTTYKVTVSASGGGAAANYHTDLYEGTSCASKTQKASIDFGDGCASFTATVTGWMYVRLSANISGTPTYTITASTGSC